MSEFISDQWRHILAYNKVDNFDALWTVEAEWHEPPNHRRGGWSGASYHEFISPTGEKMGVYIKRQENHLCKTLLHPFAGISTFRREFDNIISFARKSIPTLVPVYFAERKVSGSVQAILITEALNDFKSVDEWKKEGLPESISQEVVDEKVAGLVRDFHNKGYRHACLYPNHVFLKIDELSSELDARVIDLEKARFSFCKKKSVIRDLTTWYRHSEGLTHDSFIRFIYCYLGKDATPQRANYIFNRCLRRLEKKGHI